MHFKHPVGRSLTVAVMVVAATSFPQTSNAIDPSTAFLLVSAVTAYHFHRTQLKSFTTYRDSAPVEYRSARTDRKRYRKPQRMRGFICGSDGICLGY